MAQPQFCIAAILAVAAIAAVAASTLALLSLLLALLALLSLLATLMWRVCSRRVRSRLLDARLCVLVALPDGVVTRTHAVRIALPFANIC